MYRAIGNNEETRRFINTELDNNPTNIAPGILHVVRPGNLTHTEWVVDQLAKSDLGVVIYFQTSPTAAMVVNPILIGYLSVG